jgi:hypothetical protein
MRDRWRGWCGALLLAWAAGCGGGDGERVPVQGQVFYRGRPLAGGTIVFTPDPERGGSGPLAVAEVGADGHYSLRTDGKPGAVPGWHRVTVAPTAPAAEPAPALPRRYTDPETSGLSREVQPGRANFIDLHLD